MYDEILLVSTGRVIGNYLKAYGISEKEFAKKLGISETEASDLLTSQISLDDETAQKLEGLFNDVPASYWINYESKYRKDLAQVEAEFNLNLSENELKAIAKRFRFSEIFKGLNWTLKEQAREMLKLLEIRSFEEFEKKYSTFPIDFMEDGGETEAIAIWLNLAREEIEIQNNDLDHVTFDKDSLINSLNKFKLLAKNNDLEKSINSARKLLNKLGVYLVICDAIRNSKVRGALTTYSDKPTIYLSRRFQTHDYIWFALMHEIGHLINHYTPDETTVSYDTDFEITTDTKEREANDFARDFFINNDDYNKFLTSDNINEKSITQFAKDQQIHPGIVVARLQHDNIIGYTIFNHLRTKLN